MRALLDTTIHKITADLPGSDREFEAEALRRMNFRSVSTLKIEAQH
jgi:hypothetical protein